MTVSEPTRRERKKEETRLRIFEAAVDLFREKGFEQTTIDEITERADVGRGTFFNYFPRKEAVLSYLLGDAMARAEEESEAILAADQPTREKVASLFCRALAALEQDPELSRFVVREMLQRAFAGAPSHDKPGRALLARLVQQGVERGEIRGDVPAYRLESMLIGAQMTTVMSWLFRTDDCACVEFDPQPEMRERVNLLFAGLAPGRGAA